MPRHAADQELPEGYFEPTEETLTSMVMNDTISIGNERCYMCNIACKRHVKCTKEEHGWDVDPDYGGPEYETVAMFGSDLRHRRSGHGEQGQRDLQRLWHGHHLGRRDRSPCHGAV